MKIGLKIILQIVCALALFVGLQQLIERTTRGFCLQKIFATDIPFNPAWEVAPLNEQEQQDVDRLLDQPYSFLGAGSECFAFISEDGTTVIKFFKLDFARPLYIRRGLLLENYSDKVGSLSTAYDHLPSLLSPFDSMAKRILGMREYRIARTMLSLKLAYDHLKEETGLIYLHLNPRKIFNKTLTIYDANHIAHRVDLDSTRFFLQHRANPVTKHLLEAKQQGNEPLAQESICSLMQLMITRCHKGFADRDIVNRNFGFIGNRPIETDSGSFIPYPAMRHPRFYQQELFFGTLELRDWLVENYPELLPYFHAKLQEELQR